MRRAAGIAAPPWLAAALAAAWSAACSVDDRMIEVAPEANVIAMGTFEAGSAAMDRRFGEWISFSFNTYIGSASGGLVQPGFDSDWCLGLEWNLTDPLNGKLDYPGAGHSTDAFAPVDLTPFASLSFVHASEERQDGCTPLTSINVVIGCPELGAAMLASVPVSAAWTTASVPLASFVPAFYPPPNGTSREDCLRRAGGLQIQVTPVLADGECTSGTLRVDDIVFQ